MNKSKNAQRTRTITHALGLSCALVSSVFAFACGAYGGSGDREVFSTNDDKKPGDYKFDGHSRYSIKVYVPGNDGEYQLMELSPQNAAYFEENV